MKTRVIFVPSNENHVEIFWSICRHMEDCHPVFVSQVPLKDEGAEKAMRRLQIRFTRLADYSNDPSHAIQNEEARAVIVANDTDVVPQWFINCAAEVGVPTVLVQDGMLFDFKTAGNRLAALRSSSLELLFTALRLRLRRKYRKVAYGGAGCTKILVWDQSSKSYLVSKGADEKKIVITGSTAIYALRNSKNEAEKGTVLYIPTDLVHSNIAGKAQAGRMIDGACSAILAAGCTKLIVKPHPRENRMFYDLLADRHGSALTVSNENVYELIGKAEIVVTDISTSAAEALAAAKSVVIFMPGLEEIVAPSSFPRDLISRKAALYAGDEQTLRRHVTSLLSGTDSSKQALREMAESYFGPQEKDPSVSAAEAIKSVFNRL